MNKLSKFGKDFLLLALRINKHIKGYVDFYYGPEKLRQIVENESITSTNKLFKNSIALIQQLGSQGYNKERELYLEKLLIAMKTSIENLNGTKISIRDQFIKLYDVALQPTKEAELDNLREEIDEAYNGSGSLEERINKLRITRKVPESKVFLLFNKALKITEKRTKELFVDILPKKEQIIIDIVKNKKIEEIKWACYERYLGNYTSRIEVNPTYNMYWTSLLSYAAHEGYPGHHTEFSVKEKMLYHDLSQFEHSILLLKSPKLLISEGIADLAINVLFSYQNLVEIGLKGFCPDISSEDSLEVMIAQHKVRKKIGLFWYTFTYHALIDKYSDEQLISYGKDFEIFDEEIIKNNLRRISNPTYSNIGFTYNLGYNILKEKYGEFPSVKDFRNLLINPILPSDLV